MKAFNDALTAEYGDDTKIGTPAKSLAHFDRRMAALAAMTGGKGFRIPGKQPRVDAQGMTRGDRKRKARAIVNSRVGETRMSQFMHSAARTRLGATA